MEVEVYERKPGKWSFRLIAPSGEVLQDQWSSTPLAGGTIAHIIPESFKSRELCRAMAETVLPGLPIVEL
jgi:hypothetical protein